MRRTFGVVLLSLSVGLLAATPPPHAPAPAPTPKATLAPVPIPVVTTKAPSVVIYPFETPSDVNKDTGTAIAQIYAQVLVQSGGLTVLDIPQNIKREDYEKYAHSKGADYYISGYVQPIGTAAAIVSNVVDVNNEISVYSQTTQIQSVPEVASQALNTRTIIMRAAGIDRPDIVTGNATPAPTSTSGASVSINSIVGDLFHGRHKAAAPTPTPIPAKPARGVLLARLTGNARGGDLTRGTEALQRLMASYFNVTPVNAAENDVPAKADSLCGAHRDNTIASGILNATRSGGIRPHNSYTFTLNVYTCFGSVLYTNDQTDDDFVKAIRDAVDAYAKEHPANS